MWVRIRINNPQIQQHPLKEKARSITIARPQPQPIAVTKESARDGTIPVLEMCIPPELSLVNTHFLYYNMALLDFA